MSAAGTGAYLFYFSANIAGGVTARTEAPLVGLTLAGTVVSPGVLAEREEQWWRWGRKLVPGGDTVHAG